MDQASKTGDIWLHTRPPSAPEQYMFIIKLTFPMRFQRYCDIFNANLETVPIHLLHYYNSQSSNYFYDFDRLRKSIFRYGILDKNAVFVANEWIFEQKKTLETPPTNISAIHRMEYSYCLFKEHVIRIQMSMHVCWCGTRITCISDREVWKTAYNVNMPYTGYSKFLRAVGVSYFWKPMICSNNVEETPRHWYKAINFIFTSKQIFPGCLSTIL